MKQWKHLTLEQRKVISSGISHENKLKEIGKSLQVDPTSISKEVKRNRIEISTGFIFILLLFIKSFSRKAS